MGYQNVLRYPEGYPQWQSKGLPVARIKLETLSTPAQEKPNPSLAGWALVWTLLGIFAGGLALNLTPCVYPLIPITVSYFGGRSTQGKRELIGHGFCYIGGLALTNSLLGVFAALTGGLIGALLQCPLVLIAIAAGVHLGLLDKTAAAFRAFPWIKTIVGTLCLVMGTVLIGNQVFKGPSVNWHQYSDRLMADSVKNKKPVIIDFYANWSAPCRELDAVTFHHPDIVKLSRDDFLNRMVSLNNPG